MFFGIGALSYGIPVLSISYIRKYVDRRVLIILGTFMEGICFFFLGPEPMIFNSRIIFVILGLILFGFGIALASITTLPYMISIGKQKTILFLKLIFLINFKNLYLYEG